MAENTQIQLVTFQLGEEIYGVDIMDVKEIVKVTKVRPIPNAPYYVEGIFNLRREIIPVINLHKRFQIQKLEQTEEENEFEGGFIILNIDNNKVGIIIDKIARVVTINTEDIKDPPQMISGIGTEYITGVVRQDSKYLIMLDIRRIFSAKEMQKIIATDVVASE
ncbi:MULTISPECIES: chemotaxis protein CheW [Treponema]|jgi:purine-binding chemotaxis protein CheW|uniref:CheW protein n=1 Tax=Treponema saccharophilum DSM 2985 TaxID=907348 RepID=H7ELI4_9SPIR|nr:MULTISPECIES: chemotaxis protein CheW [Treponema]EIC01525.1 CheW protein [Treponema saccharophilum DSM 2985]MBQ5536937.1 purine-binding chemotaxis protein CheW [Treponema sp.]BDC95569.1 chemotaxis protein CheW [Treponema saccharophilum]